MLDVSETHVRKSILPLLAADCTQERIEKKQRRVYYYARGVIDALKQKERDSVVAASGGDPEMLGHDDSPSAERVRMLRGDLLAMDLQERRGEVVRAGLVRQALLRGFGVLRGVADAIQRRYGPDAGDQIRNGLDDAEREAIGVLHADDAGQSDATD